MFRKRKFNFVNGVSGDWQQDVLKSLWKKRSLADRSGMFLGVVWLTKRIHHTWKVVKGVSLFNSDLIYDSDL